MSGGKKMAGGFDLVIKNGMVVDGTGSPWVKKDIGVFQDRIAKVGHIEGEGKKVIDARGKTFPRALLTFTATPTILSLPAPTPRVLSRRALPQPLWVTAG